MKTFGRCRYGVAARVGSDATIRNENADSGISNGYKLIASYSGCYTHAVLR